MGKNRGLYLPDAESDFAESRARELHDGNFNAYVIDLIRNDRFGRIATDRDDIILVLMRTYDGAFEEEMKELLGKIEGGANQKQLVKHFLEALRRALKRGDDLTWPFDLIERQKQRDWERDRDRYAQLLERIGRKILGEEFPVNSAPDLEAAEGSADYVVRKQAEKRAKKSGAKPRS